MGHAQGCGIIGFDERPISTTLGLFAISAIVYCPFAQWISTAPIGTVIFLWLELAYAFALMAAVFAIPVFLVRSCFRRTRPESAAWLVVCMFFIPCCVGGITLGQRVRTAGMLSFTQRSRPPIAAIEEYGQDHSVPPPTLDALVPDYLSAVPTTGMMAYPEYEYHTGVDTRREYAGNPWALSVFTPSGGINFDRMLYFPKQNYPKHGYSGWLEPIGDWAYVHEEPEHPWARRRRRREPRNTRKGSWETASSIGSGGQLADIVAHALFF